MNGKGSSPRNVGPKFKENYDSIDWRRKPNMIIGNLYTYKNSTYKYLGKTVVQDMEYYQMEDYPDKETGGIYLLESELKDLKVLTSA